MAKKLMINCATCDARNILEENYAHYEQITVNNEKWGRTDKGWICIDYCK